MAMRRSGATGCLRRWPPGPPSGAGAVACVPRWALGSITSCGGGPSAPRRRGCSSHVCQRSPSARTRCRAGSLACGSPPSRSSAALRRRCPPRSKPTSASIAAASPPSARAARPTALRHACPSRCKGSFHAPSPTQGRGGQGRPQRPRATAPGLLCQGDGPLQPDFVQVRGHEPHTQVAPRALAEGRRLGAQAIQPHLPALGPHRECHGISVTPVTRGRPQGGEGHQTGCHRLFAGRLRPLGLGQSVLARGLQPLLTVCAQKHKELSLSRFTVYGMLCLH